jgi:hypothetical protein
MQTYSDIDVCNIAVTNFRKIKTLVNSRHVDPSHRNKDECNRRMAGTFEVRWSATGRESMSLLLLLGYYYYYYYCNEHSNPTAEPND